MARAQGTGLTQQHTYVAGGSAPDLEVMGAAEDAWELILELLSFSFQ